MRTLTLVLAILAVGCTNENAAEEVLESYEHGLTALQDAVDAYSTDVASAASTSDVTALQATYDDDADHAIEDLHHALEDIEGCDHDAMGQGMVVDAHGELEEIEDAITDLLAGHAGHSDVTDCQTAATAHESYVEDQLDLMDAHHDQWHDEMTCEHHDDGGHAH